MLSLCSSQLGTSMVDHDDRDGNADGGDGGVFIVAAAVVRAS